jgi:hypothetical protein
VIGRRKASDPAHHSEDGLTADGELYKRSDFEAAAVGVARVILDKTKLQLRMAKWKLGAWALGILSKRP